MEPEKIVNKQWDYVKEEFVEKEYRLKLDPRAAVPDYDFLPKNYKIGVLVALACSGRLITPELLIAMTMQHTPMAMNQTYCCVKGLKVEDARERLAKLAIASKAQYLWFIDDDTIPPPQTLRKLLYQLQVNPEAKICGGVYCCKSKPEEPVLGRGWGEGVFWNWKAGEVFEVDWMGAGCMLIDVSVFKHLTPPYFPWDWPEAPADDALKMRGQIGEDISFCNKVREAGFKILAHGGCLCDHYDADTDIFYRLPEDSYPLRKEVN
jgi:hypothetical protein